MPRKSKPDQPAKRDPGQLTIDGRYFTELDAERMKNAEEASRQKISDEVIARALAQPEVRAAVTIQRFYGEQMDVNACAEELRQQVALVKEGNLQRPEAMLVAQAHTLDALFSSLSLRSQSNSSAGYLEAAEKYMRLALKAQAQAVRTIEALSELKNPRPVAFVRQANFAQNQQVNNGVPSRAEENEIQRNELSGTTYELCQDSQASCLAGRIDPQLEAVGALHRPEDTGR